MLPQEPKEGLYICIDNYSSCLNPLEETDKKIVVGTPLQFFKKTDLDEYLFKDAEGNQFEMTAYDIQLYLRKIPNRLPNRTEKLLRWFLEFDKYADNFKNPSHVQFTLLGALLSFVPQSFISLMFLAMCGESFLPMPFLFLIVIPWIPNLCLGIVKRKRKVRGEFLCILRSPFRDQLLTELVLLLKQMGEKYI